MTDDFNVDAAVDDYLGNPASELPPHAKMQTGVAQGITTNPDQYAEQRRIAGVTGVPVQTVLDYPEEMTRRASLDAIDFKSYADEHPKSAIFLADPEIAKIAHDDMDNMGGFERSLRALFPTTSLMLDIVKSDPSLVEGMRRAPAGAGTAFMVGVGPSASAGIYGVLESASALVDPWNAPGGPRSTFGSLRKESQQYEQNWMAPYTENAGFLEKALYSAAQSIGQSLPFTAVAALNPAAATTLATPTTPTILSSLKSIPAPIYPGMAIQGGRSAAEALDKGANPYVAATHGAVNAFIEGATEATPYLKLVEDLDAHAPFTKVLVHQLLSDTQGEVMATLGQKLTDWSTLTPEKKVGDFVKELTYEEALTVASTVMAVGAQTGAIYGAGKVVERAQQMSASAGAAQENAKVLEQINKLSEASKLKLRDPMAFAAFVEQAAKDAPVSDIYIDANSLAQSGVDINKLRELSPTANAQMDNLATGGQIRIPLAEYAANIAGTPEGEKLFQHVKTTPEGMTAVEAENFMKTQGEALKAEVEKVLATKADADLFTKSADAVRENILGQLKAANRFQDEVHQPYATLMSNFYAVQAARLGISPEEMFARFPVRIQAQGMGGLMHELNAPPTDARGNVTLDHWSDQAGLTTLDPAQWGKSPILTRQERERIGSAPGRTYFGIASGQPGGYRKELGLGQNRYQASIPLQRLYDMNNDPDGLREIGRNMVETGQWPKGRETRSLYENLIKDAGYSGYWVKAPSGIGLVAAVFDPMEVTSVQEKTDAQNAGGEQAFAQTGRNDGRDGRGVQPVDERAGPNTGADQPLQNLPRSVVVDGKPVEFGPFEVARRAAEAYMAQAGLAYNPPREYVKVDTARAQRIANEFDLMPHNPADPETARAYRALVAETLAQYQAIKATGLKVEFINGKDPYGNPRNAILDVVNNNHLWVFPTDAGFGGTASTLDVSDNPLLAITDEVISGRQARVNDIFRIVHDYFGHVKEGVGFRADGEENAWRSHAAMYTPLARRALTTETRGQNSWVNFGPYAESNKTASGEDTQYAPQKIGLLPEWVSTEGAGDNVLYQSEPNLVEEGVFYSPLQRAVESAKQDIAPPQQWAGIINNLPGMKKEELEWSGIQDWLATLGDTPISKESILEYLKANELTVVETVLNEDGTEAEMPSDYTQSQETTTGESYSTTLDLGRGRTWQVQIVEAPEVDDVSSRRGGTLQYDGWYVMIDNAIENRDDPAATKEEALEFLDDLYTSYYVGEADVEGSLKLEDFVKGERSYTTNLHDYEFGYQSFSYRVVELVDGSFQAQRLDTHDADSADLGNHDTSENALEAIYNDADDIEQNVRDNYVSGDDRENQTKFHQYKLPGGDNYTELLIRLPDLKNTTGSFTEGHFDQKNVVAHVRFDTRVVDGKKMLFIEEIQSDWHQKGRKKGYRGYKSSQPKITVEELEDAKNAAIDAVAAYEGSKTDRPQIVDAPAIVRALGNAALDSGGITDYSNQPEVPADTIKAINDFQRTLLAYEAYENATRNGVPNAPFKTTWQELAFKRMIAYAIQGGYDSIGWTTGQQQVERYNSALQKRVDVIEWEKTPDGVHLIGYKNKIDPASEQTLDREKVVDTKQRENELSDAIGKAMADRILNDPNQSGEIEGNDITISDTGMAGFYDGMLPKFVDKFTKKFGGKSTMENLDKGKQYLGGVSGEMAMEAIGVPEAEQAAYWRNLTPEQRDAMIEEYRNNKGVSTPVHNLDITPEMREAFQNGLPLFQGGSLQRGSYNPDTQTISILQAADLSTFLHESGHFFLDTLNRMALMPDAPTEVKADMDILLGWFGVKDLATWNNMTLEQQRLSHEKFARGFEAYLMEGKSPNTEMRGIFRRFRAWLLHIYKTLVNLNVQLTDDVRGVFDRMLATNDQIKEAENVRFGEPLFQSPEEGKMSPEEWKAYQDLGNDASQEAINALEVRSIKDMKWLSNARDRKIRELQREANSKRAAIRKEVISEVRQEPVYAADMFIRRGELDDKAFENMNRDERRKITEAGLGKTKLDLGALKAMYGEEANAPWRYLPTGQYGLVGENGMHPDTLAEMFGFTSGDHLVRALLEAEPMREKINGMTDQRMLERYGDLTDPQSIARAADEAIHNDARTRFVATELAAMNRALGKPRVLMSAVRDFAENMLARTRVRDLKPTQYAAAEAKEAKLAEKALRKGDTQEAYQRKRNQLIQNYAAGAAYRAEAEIAKALRYLEKFGREGTRKNLTPDANEQIDGLLARFDLRKSVSLKTIDNRKSIAAWIEAQKALGLEPDINETIANDAFRKHYKDLTLEEFRGLMDAVKQIEHLGRKNQKLLTAADQARFDAVKADILASIDTHKPKTPVDLRTKVNEIGPMLVDGGKQFLAMHRKMASMLQQMDGFKDGGPLWNYIVRSMNARGDKEATMREQATKKLAKIADPILKGGKMGGKGMYFPSLNISLNRESRIAIALNMGNAGNAQRLLDGEGWTLEQLSPVLETLTKEDWDFVQNIWDFFESYREEVGAKEKRVYGKEPKWVEPTPVNTRFGEYRGGYYPIKYDPARSGAAQQHADAEDAKAMLQGAYTSATTRRSFTKKRSDEVKGRPLMYSFAGIYNGVNEIIHDLSWHEWLIDANRILRDKAIDSAIRNNYGAETVSLIKNAIRDIAQGDTPAANVWERGINHLRTGATIAGLGWNFTTALLQPLGLTNSMVRIGPGWVAQGIKQWLKSPVDIVEDIYGKSEFMRLRGKTMQREINEIQNRVSRGRSKTREMIDTSMFVVIQKMQLVADVPTWLGMYEKTFAETGDEAKSVALADQAVIDAQGGGQIKDLSAIQRGGPLQKLFTNFYSYFNVVHNLSVDIAARTNWKNPADVAVAARDYLLLYIAPVVLGVLLKAALAGGGGDNEDGDDLLKKLINEQISYLMGTMVGVREVTGVVQTMAGVNQFDASSYNGPAGLRFMNELFKFGKQVNQGELDDALRRSTLNTAGILFHLPSGQMNKTIDGTQALTNGETKNPLAVVTGAPK